MENFENVIEKAKNYNCNLLLNENMAKHTSFKIGGNAKLFVEVNDLFSLKAIINLLKKSNIKFKIIGNGSNLLISDTGLDFAVLKLSGKFNEIKLQNSNEIIAGSAVKLSSLCKFAMENSLSGLEFAYGIPGSVGGAVFMNAGAYGGEIKDILTSCSFIDKNLNEIIFKNSQAEFGYRSSVFSKNNGIITKACFKLHPDKKENINKKMQEILQRRKDKQPLELPSAGSVFKRPEGNFAGTLIDKSGLKGKSIGGAQVSTKHAGFIVNKGSATCNDVLNLIDYIQKTVLEKHGVKLEPEIKLWGD